MKVKKEGDLKTIFAELKNILSKYSPPLIASSDLDSKYELYSKKDIEWAGHKFKEIQFGAAVIQSSYVGLYLMHIYAKPVLIDKIPERLRKCLKGKSCFHIREWDAEMKKIIEKTVKDGISCYKKENLNETFELRFLIKQI